jgi:hypothetical protein
LAVRPRAFRCDRIEIGGQPGVVRTIEPLLRELEVRLVVPLLPDHG